MAKKRNDLTREWLNSVGIKIDTIITYEDKAIGYHVSKTSKRRGTVKLKPHCLKQKNDLASYYYCFTVNKKRYAITCARVIYALLNGVCPGDKVVTYDENGDLVLMTQKELYHKKVWERR